MAVDPIRLVVEVIDKGGGAGKLTQGIAGLAFGFNQVTAAVQTFAAKGKQAYEVLIGANERLTQQLLASQATLAATSRILVDGVEQSGRDAVRATGPALREALKTLERETLELVGVTSQQVNQVFQVVLSNASSLAGQSKEFGSSIEAAIPLTKSLVASLGVLNVPLEQANQEIRSILQGQVTSDSLLARQLNLSNEQVRQYKAQGILIDKLNERLEPFVLANADAARSITGITSNLQDSFEIIFREAGEPLLDPIIDQLANLEKFIKENQQAITDFFSDGVKFAQELISNLAPIVDIFAEVLTPVVSSLAGLFDGTLVDALRSATTGVKLFVEFSKPALGVVAAQVGLLINALSAVIDRLNDAVRLSQSVAGATKLEFDILEQQKESIRATEKFVDDIRAKQASGAITAAQAQGAISSAIKQEEEAIKRLNIQTIDNIGLKDALLSRLGVLRDTTKESSSEIDIQTRKLDELGTTATQLAKKVLNAQRVIESPTDRQSLDQAFQEQIESTNQLLELGDRTVQGSLEDFESLQSVAGMTRQEAVETFEAIAENTQASAETQIKAIESIKKIRQDQIKGLQRDFEEENVTAKELIEQLEEIASLPGKANREVRDNARNAINQTADAELSRAVQSSTNIAAEGAAINSRLINEFLKENRDREVEANQVRVEARRIDIEESKIAEEIKLKSLTARLEAEEERIGRGLPRLLNRSAREKIEQDIRQSKIETARITDQFIQNEIEQQDALFAVISKNIADELAAEQNLFTVQQQREQQREQQISKERQGLDTVNRQLKIQTDLLATQSGLISSRQDLQTATDAFLQGEQAILATGLDQEEQQELQFKLKGRQLELLENQQLAEQRQLEIQIQQEEIARRQNRLALEREQIENRIAESQARAAQLQGQAELAQAQANQKTVEADPRATAEQKEAAGLQVSAAQVGFDAALAQVDLRRQEGRDIAENLSVFDQQQSGIDEVNDNRRSALDLRQTTSRRQIEFERLQLLPDDAPLTKQRILDGFRGTAERNTSQRRFDQLLAPIREQGRESEVQRQEPSGDGQLIKSADKISMAVEMLERQIADLNLLNVENINVSSIQEGVRAVAEVDNSAEELRSVGL